jgi:hypothetical protein
MVLPSVADNGMEGKRVPGKWAAAPSSTGAGKPGGME